MWSMSVCPEQSWVAGSCKRENKLLGFAVEGVGFLDWLSDYQLHKDRSAF
jgi:hypothetical protein